MDFFCRVLGRNSDLVGSVRQLLKQALVPVVQTEDNTMQPLNNLGLGPVSRKSPELFGPEKAIRKITACLFCKAGLFICRCKRNKNEDNCKVSCLGRLRFEKKRIMSPEIRPKSFGTFEKQAPEFKYIPRQNEGHVWRIFCPFICLRCIYSSRGFSLLRLRFSGFPLCGNAYSN